jgi:hypothetical protein
VSLWGQGFVTESGKTTDFSELYLQVLKSYLLYTLMNCMNQAQRPIRAYLKRLLQYFFQGLIVLVTYRYHDMGSTRAL